MLNLFVSKNIFKIEKKSVFFINSFFIILMIIFLFLKIDISIFFYILIIITFILSYFFFKHSKKLSKYIILTNLFIYFYFLFPKIAKFLYDLFGYSSYVFVLFYNLIIAYLFLSFSGCANEILFKNIKKTNIKIIGLIFLVGLFFGLFFYLVREPIPFLFDTNSSDYFFKAGIFTLILAFSEQMIFTGFLYNTYKKLTNKTDAILQTSTLFLLFHMLRISNLAQHFIYNFGDYFLIMIVLYLILIFIFMTFAIFLYDFKASKKHKSIWHGNFLYSVLLHFIVDFFLFVFYFL